MSLYLIERVSWASSVVHAIHAFTSRCEFPRLQRGSPLQRRGLAPFNVWGAWLGSDRLMSGLARCAWRHRSIDKFFCYNCCLHKGAVVVSLSRRMDHMIVRFSECTSISHQNGCESRKRAARGLFRSSFRFFVLAYFLHFSVFLLVG